MEDKQVVPVNWTPEEIRAANKWLDARMRESAGDSRCGRCTVLENRMVEHGGFHAGGDCYAIPMTAEFIENLRKQVAGRAENQQVAMIRGLVRAAELLEADRNHAPSGTVWDDEVRGALELARAHGWGKHQIGALPSTGAEAPEERRSFTQDLETLINRHSQENASMTPDFILASFLKGCLDNWNQHTVERDRWWSHKPSIGGNSDMSVKIESARAETGSAFTLSDITKAREDLAEGPLPSLADRPLTWVPPSLKPLDFPMGLKGAINQVYLFHEKFGIPWYTNDPQWPGPKRVALRERLMRDEREELEVAWDKLNDYLLGAGCDDNVVCAGDGPEEFGQGFRERLAAIAREMVDEIYTIIGTAGEFGIDLAAVWDVVHRANMAKVGGGQDAQGKVLKPEDWTEPDVEGAIFGKT